MAVERERKSWTCVNERPCDECGFDASTTDHHDIGGLVLDVARAWSGILVTDEGGHRLTDLVTRQDEHTWSPLEDACHVRDVLALLMYRFERTLVEDRPSFEPWHPNDRAADGDDAAERDPADVASAIGRHARRVADLAASMTDEWARAGTRADGFEFTNATLATYLTHDVVHHLHDVERVLAAG